MLESSNKTKTEPLLPPEDTEAKKRAEKYGAANQTSTQSSGTQSKEPSDDSQERKRTRNQTAHSEAEAAERIRNRRNNSGKNKEDKDKYIPTEKDYKTVKGWVAGGWAEGTELGIKWAIKRDDHGKELLKAGFEVPAVSEKLAMTVGDAWSPVLTPIIGPYLKWLPLVQALTVTVVAAREYRQTVNEAVETFMKAKQAGEKDMGNAKRE